MRAVRAALAALALALAIPGPLGAVETTAPKTVPLPPPPPPDRRPTPDQPDVLPPYQPQLERLAELMGTLAFMRDLCGRGDGADWRAKMADLVESEGKSDLRRDRLAGAYNRGFQGYAAVYTRCTPSAELVIERALDESDRLTRDLATRFGGG